MSASDLAGVVAGLVARIRDDDAERTRCFPHPYSAERALEATGSGRLCVPTGAWFHEVLVDPDGSLVVRVLELRDSDLERPPANALEANFAWHSVLDAFPDLSPWAPTRPSDATTCEFCCGSGVPPWRENHPGVACNCGGAGWRPAGADAMKIFDDWPDLGGERNDAAPASETTWTDRVRRWFRGN
jgi:hypothetical protein